eukprot:TRINITY_DN12761_c0_g1_i7.p1 TRINITY_DN12761_c0_g1~~TRINITY_DN12761_c0_g1_i7.p1  ORF type:complete len:124 (-),score=25.90 TRINITY_DN12761_c0_g1_i7:519-890(-)
MTKLLYDNKDILTKRNPWIEITTGESHLRMYKDVFVSIERELRNKFKCTYTEKSALFQCEVKDKSYSPFKILEIHLTNIVIYVEPQEYVRFVWLGVSLECGREYKEDNGDHSDRSHRHPQARR